MARKEILRSRGYWTATISNSLWRKYWILPDWLCDKIADKIVDKEFMNIINTITNR